MWILRWKPVLLPFLVALLGTSLQWSGTFLSASSQAVLTSLYYPSIVIAGIGLGSRGAAIVALAAGAFEASAAMLGRGDRWAPPVAQTIMFVSVGLMAAWLTERLRSDGNRTKLTKALGPPAGEGMFNEVYNANQMSTVTQVVLGLARQIRTPLTSIEGAGWVLNDAGLPDDKRQEFVAIVRKEANRLNRVLSDLMEFARLQKPRFRRSNLSSLVDEAIQLTGPRDSNHVFLFRKDIPADFPRLWCDPEQIRQVLLNLFRNSIQASAGGGKIEIAAETKDGNAVIRVRDYGPGVPAQVRRQIFDPFFTTHEDNLGLGLSVALYIVNEHGGRMSVESDSAIGCCFTITLPL